MPEILFKFCDLESIEFHTVFIVSYCLLSINIIRLHFKAPEYLRKLMPKRSHTLLLNIRRSKLEIFVGEKEESYAISITLIFNLLPWNRKVWNKGSDWSVYANLHYQQWSPFRVSNHLQRHLFTMLFCSLTPSTMLDSINLDNRDAIFVDNC